MDKAPCFTEGTTVMCFRDKDVDIFGEPLHYLLHLTSNRESAGLSTLGTAEVHTGSPRGNLQMLMSGVLRNIFLQS